MMRASLCASNNGASLSVSGTRETPGDSGGPDTRRDGGSPPATTEPEEFDPNRECIRAWAGVTDCFRMRPGEPDPESEPAAPAGRPLTITDLAEFAPAATTTSTEPDNVAIAGLPANFLGTSDPQTRTGTLFGEPITVTFSPVAYDYTYGDGAAATLSSPGRTWADLGQAQFSPTATSHIYDAPGVYLADVDVRYTAMIDFGTGAFPVAGELTTDGPPQEIRVLEARTALVAHTCSERPAAPGC